MKKMTGELKKPAPRFEDFDYTGNDTWQDEKARESLF